MDRWKSYRAWLKTLLKSTLKHQLIAIEVKSNEIKKIFNFIHVMREIIHKI